MGARYRLFLSFALVGGVAALGCDGIDPRDIPWEDLTKAFKDHHRPPAPSWQEMGARRPILDRNGQPGMIVRPTFVDAHQPQLMSAVICPANALQTRNWLHCRPATSHNRGATFELHDSPVFEVIEQNGWGDWTAPAVARSPADTHRMYYAASGHPWNTPDPKGGLWRSDDGGRTWTENLVAGQPGESGEITVVIPDPNDADRVYINRGYDFGNVSVSHDAGATFSIVCGDNNVEKTTEDIWCTQSATLALDFSHQRLYFKHYFQTVAVTLRLDGTDGQTLSMPGLTEADGEAAFIASQDVQLDLPIAGLSPRPVGGRSFRFSADGAWAVFVDDDDGSPDQRLWKDAADFSSGAEVPSIVPGGTKIVLTHPRHACTWLIQTGPATLMKTNDCAATWSSVSMTGFTSPSPIVAGAYAPDRSSTLVLFTENGQRFRAAVP